MEVMFVKCDLLKALDIELSVNRKGESFAVYNFPEFLIVYSEISIVQRILI